MTADSDTAWSLLESLRYSPSGGYFLLDRHLARLAQSAALLGFSFDRIDACSRLAQVGLGIERLSKVRLVLERTGELAISSEALVGPAEIATAISPVRVRSDDFRLRHKTTEREVYSRALGAVSGVSDVILQNERGELTETCIGNLALRLAGEWLTPRLDAGLLPGTFRAHLVASGLLREATLCPGHLAEACEVYRINSVRLWTRLDVRGLEPPSHTLRRS